MNRRASGLVLAACSATFLSIACGDGIVEGDVPNASGLPTAGAPSSGSAGLSGSSAAIAGSSPASSGSSATGGVPGSSAGSGGMTSSTAGAGVTPQGGGSQAGNGGSSSLAGAGGTSGQTGNGGTAATPSEPECDDDEALCGTSCVDVQSNDDHCGGCNDACPAAQECRAGNCECSNERTLCGDSCVDTDSDEQNCGSCGSKCATGASCNDGKCSGGDTGGVVTSCSSISDYGTVSSTIVVKNGQTYDGKCQRYRADPNALGDGSQDEGQKPVFRLEGGAKLINVVLGAPAADGIHTEGDVTLENITWEDVGEDALTIKKSGTVSLNGGSAKNADDKIFQLNAASTFRLSNFKATNAGKLIRQVGDSTFKVAVFIDRCDISGMDESIFRTDSSSSTVSMTNTRYRDIGTLFIGVSSGNITQSNNTQY